MRLLYLTTPNDLIEKSNFIFNKIFKEIDLKNEISCLFKMIYGLLNIIWESIIVNSYYHMKSFNIFIIN